MSRARILVTGGTGFLGRQVVPRLREHFDVDVFSRSEKADVRGDLTQWNAGLEDVSALKGRYAACVHLAGLYDLNADSKQCYLHNILGTIQMLRFSERLEIPVILNASSVAAGINAKSEIVLPEYLSFERAFPDAYSESKAYGERALLQWKGKIRHKVNLRLGVLVGDSRTGEIDRLDGPYAAPQAFSKLSSLIESFPGPLPLPGDASKRLPILPVDICAEAVVKFALRAVNEPGRGFESHHVVPNEGLEIEKLYKSVMKHLLIRHRGVHLVSQLPTQALKKISKWTMGLPEAQLTYLLQFPKYDSTSTREILGQNWCPEFESYERNFWSGYEKYVSNR